MFDIAAIIHSAGIIGLNLIVFAESGLFFGFFLPGDSLLFTAGLLASQGYLNIIIMLITLPIAAILGDSVGYWFGRKVGNKLFTREESLIFKPSHVKRAHEFFLKHGKRSIFLARFLPIVRTFVPIVAGVADMPYRDFIRYNIIGGFTWIFSMTLLGYFLGRVIPNAEHYILPISLGIIAISFIPVIKHLREK